MGKERQSDFLLINSELTAAQVRAVQRRIQAGELHRLARGMATSLPPDQWPVLVQREKQRILASLFPGAVVGFRSAFNGMVGSPLYLTYTHSREAELPGLKVIAVEGPPAQPGDIKMAGKDIYFPSQARMFLDNMTRNDGNRNVSRQELEERLLKICESSGEDRLQKLRGEIEALAVPMKRERQAQELSKMIGELLGSRSLETLSSPKARAIASAYDPLRIERFEQLIAALRVTAMPAISEVAPSGVAQTNFAFLESYFSNFIEGTEFEISEARQIVLEGKIIETRPKDSHDIIGVFEQIIDPGWRFQSLSTTPVVIQQLSERHARMMRMRPEVQPGEFKLLPNRAGNSVFVEPKLARGTLLEGAKRVQEIEPGLARALYAMFLVAEIHPFNDGNGRLARLVMNAELSQAGQCRIIIPTLYRETYLDCLRVLTRDGDPKPYLKAMIDIQKWTASFRYDSLDAVLKSMKECNAFESSRDKAKLLRPSQDESDFAPVREGRA
jgi:hypothetical protein